MSIKYIGDRVHGLLPQNRGVSRIKTSLASDGRVVWLDFDDSSTITLNGPDISDIQDKSTSGSDNDFSQSTSANQPFLDVASQNGLDAAQFATTNNLDGAYFSMASGLSISIAFNATTLGSLRILLACVDGGAGDRIAFGPQSDGRITISMSTSSGNRIGRDSTAGDVVVGTWKVLFVTYDGGLLSSGCKIYDGTNTQIDVIDQSGGAFTGVPATSAAPLVLGLRNGIFPFIGEIGEVAMWPEELSAAKRAAEITRMAGRWL